MKRRRLVAHLVLFLFGLALLSYQQEKYSPSPLRHSSKTSNWAKEALGDFKRRKNMEECPAIYGKIGIFVGNWKNRTSPTARDSIRCYVRSTNYTLFEIDVAKDNETQTHCSQYKKIMFRRHCAVALYAKKVDWLLVLDGDTAVVNPNHCIEEYIDPSVDLIFYERFHNFEFAAGNFLVRYSNFSRNFLLDWAGYFNEKKTQRGYWFSNLDNGALLIHLARTLRPEAKPEIDYCNKVRHKVGGISTYFGYVTCVRWILGAQREFPGKIRLHRRAQGLARDLQADRPISCAHDFMFHGVKEEKNPIFTQKFNVSECGRNFNGWNWNMTNKVSCKEVKKELIRKEEFFRKDWFPNSSKVDHFLSYREMRCWPNCDEKVGNRT